MKITRKDVLTVPNLLSLLRLLMIPLFVWLYLRGLHGLTATVLVLSGATDVIDGWYARRFGAVSDLGKALDPVADKLTQAAMLLCLVSRWPKMLWVFVLMFVKELFAGVSGLMVIRRTDSVPGAVWHGKVTTMLLYLMLITHVLWQDIPASVSNTLYGTCIVMMLLSMVLYGIRNVTAIRESGNKRGD